MSDVEGVQGGGEPHQYSQEELEKYHQDYEKGLNLFKESFDQYNQPNLEVHKKAQLKKVMDEALQVMNETACVALKQGKRDHEVMLNIHYQTFIEDPSADNQKKVADDIKALSD
ncbi:hypothetical protein [Candidatus Neptunichlamydia sp. REUL1]|uniref:hypothetical protein n=1 Tax=Candidatus Neptunichlamydia sp. REUL1 TaxID=3064277 RepID=UPI00292E7FD1|nr:hypothetical protein [Candidatus Neptunochlamydia sp. REUL1]